MKRYMRRLSASLFKTVLYGFVLVLILGGLAYATFRAYGQRKPDMYGCYEGVKSPATYVVIDASEPRFNVEQARSLRSFFDTLYGNLGFNERLSFFTSEADQIASIAKPRFHVCGQASAPEQLEAVGAAVSQAGFLKKQTARLYEKTVAPELDAILSDAPDPSRRQRYQSPILEMIADISRHSDVKPGSRIILASDLIQNSDSVQFCRVQNDMPPFSVFKERPVYARLKPNSLQGVEVDILMIQRLGYGQAGLEFCADEDELAAFWRDYFVENGAKVNVIRIRHGIIAG